MGNFSFSQFISGSSSIDSGNQFSQMLKFQASPTENNTILVLRVGTQGDTFPLFSFTISKTSKPNIQLRRIGAGYSVLQPTLIGDATFHSLSSKIDLNWNGQAITMKPSQLSGSQKLECQPYGKLKWDGGKATGHKLMDGTGSQIARYRSGWSGIKGASLEISIQCDDLFLDLVVLSLVAVVQAQSKESEAAAKIIGEVAGA